MSHLSLHDNILRPLFPGNHNLQYRSICMINMCNRKSNKTAERFTCVLQFLLWQQQTVPFCLNYTLVDLGTRGTSLSNFFSFSCSFLAKIMPNHRLAPPRLVPPLPREILDPDCYRDLLLAAATAQTRPSNSVPMAGLGGFQVGGRPIVLRQLLLW